MTTVHRTVPPPPRRAVWSAWAIPLLVLPSALWRAGKAFDDARGLSAVTDGGWYLLLLSVLALSLLSLGLVKPWGIAYPAWIPGVGGQIVNARRAAVTAQVGGWLLIVLSLYLTWNLNVGNLLTFEPAVGTTEQAHQLPDMGVLRWYLPLYAWAPLLIAIAVDYRRRTRSADRKLDEG